MKDERAAGEVIILTLLATMATASLVACSSGGDSTPGPVGTGLSTPAVAARSAKLGTTYHSPDGYRINPPEGWLRYPIPTPSNMSTSFTSTTLDPASPYADTMYVMVTPTGAPLEAVVAEAKQSYGTILPGYRVITDQPIQLSGGQPAHLLSGTFRTLRVGRQILQLVTVHSGKAYAVTFMAAGSFGDMQSPFQKSVSSFALE